jgi:four helix bundle protein
MSIRRVEDLVAYQFAVEFKLEVYRLIRESREASWDRKYRMQLSNAVDGVDANMTEGFRRCGPGELATFLRYALASLAEAETRLKNGILRGYFAAPQCEEALAWARRCRAATQGDVGSCRGARIRWGSRWVLCAGCAASSRWSASRHRRGWPTREPR